MSKSLGNGIDPFDIIDKYGVDSLRYFLATTAAPGQDMRFSEEKVNSCQNYLNKIWNSARYILINIPEDFDSTKIDIKKLGTIDKFILSKLERTIQKITKAMDKYEYGIASSLLYDFVYDDFCSFYIEMSKVSLHSDNSYKDGVYFTLLKVLQAVVMMIYPFSPFITEEIYQNLPNKKESIMLESYPEYERKFVNKEYEEKGVLLKTIIDQIRVYKVNNKLAPNAKIDIKIKTDENINDLLDYISRFAFANSLELTKEDVPDSTSIVLSNLTIYILDNTNKDELKNTLNKELSRLQGEIKRSEGMLSNKNFLDKAPKEKIDAEKKKYDLYLNQLKEIEEKLKKL